MKKRSAPTEQNLNGDRLELKYVHLSTVELWDRNPKIHSIDKIIASMDKHGFKSAIKFEPTLNDGKGGIVAGNGRITALRKIKNDGGKPPRGIIAEKDDWLIPVLFGVDAVSQAAAEAYAIDDNNITMLGGDFTQLEIAKMWDAAGYADILKFADQNYLVSLNLDESKTLLPLLNAMTTQGSYFDASKLPDAPEKIDESAFIIYLTFDEKRKFIKAALVLSYGERRLSEKSDFRSCVLDSSKLVEKWETDIPNEP